MILWLKAFHVIFMVSWFAGLFYLPRLFVYHASCEDTAGNERFKIMEHKLYNYIMTPALVITATFGIWMMVIYGLEAVLQMNWLLLKLGLVVILIGFHFYCGNLVKTFAKDENHHPEKYFRLINEIPTVILIAVIILVYVRPF